MNHMGLVYSSVFLVNHTRALATSSMGISKENIYPKNKQIGKENLPRGIITMPNMQVH